MLTLCLALEIMCSPLMLHRNMARGQGSGCGRGHGGGYRANCQNTSSQSCHKSKHEEQQGSQNNLGGGGQNLE